MAKRDALVRRSLTQTDLQDFELSFWDKDKRFENTIRNRKVSSPRIAWRNKKEVRSVFGWTDVQDNKDASSQSSGEEKEPKKKETLQGTFSNQSDLPKLPVPSLEDTCKLYLESVKPLSTIEDFITTKAAVDEFIAPGGVGEMLQKKLVAKSQTRCPSWLEDWWDDSYCEGRAPISVHVNYFYTFEDQPRPEEQNQVSRAAGLLHGALTFRQEIEAKTLSPDSERGTPLCMSQYPRLFACSRVPGKKRDHLITYQKEPIGRDFGSKTTQYEYCDSKHVVVLHKDNFYSMRVLDKGSVRSISYIEQCLSYILTDARSQKTQLPIGTLTSEERDQWATVREDLIEHSKKNADILKVIQSALIILCLDDKTPQNVEELCRVALHGDGSNRWFDKNQLIVCRNGKAGVVWEHASADGTSTLRLADTMYKHCCKYGSKVPNTKPPAKQDRPERLQFKLSEDIKDSIKAAYLKYRELVLNNATSMLRFTKFGGKWIKENKMSPDAFIQIAIQLAYYKMFGNCCATYESASTRTFFHGRTETVRSCSLASLEFVKSSFAPLLSYGFDNRPSQLTLLKQAVESHVAYMRKAKKGMGVDRHLFGLGKILEELRAKGEDIEVPQLFTDPNFKKSSHWKLSSSHCGSPSLSAFGFGPVVTRGFGIGYMIKNDSISFCVTGQLSKHREILISSELFASLVEQSILHMNSIVLSNPEHQIHVPKSLEFTHPTVNLARFASTN